MDLKILEIASHTENKKELNNPTHSSKTKIRFAGTKWKLV